MEIQATYFQAIQSPRSSKKWQSSLIRLLWETSWDIWDCRNDIEHGAQNCNLSSKKRNLCQEIRLQWELGAPELFERQYFRRGSLDRLCASEILYQ